MGRKHVQERVSDYVKTLAHNVRLVYLFTFFNQSARSILFQQVLSGYVYVLTGSNQPVGFVKGVQGICQLCVAYPSGYVADHYRRDTALRVSGIIGLFAAIISFFAFDNSSMPLLYVAFGIWGVFTALQTSAMEALFADSVPQGSRSFPFTLKHALMNLAYTFGPLMSIALFWYYGNHWQLPELQTVLVFGTVFSGLSMTFLFYFDDEKAHEQQEEAKGRSACTETTYLISEQLEESQDVPHEEVLMETHRHVESNNVTCFGMLQQQRHVPIILFCSDFVISNGAGMTINFFPLFFFQEYGLSPIDVSYLFLAQPLIVIVMSFVAQRLSNIVGRMPVIIASRFASTCCLLSMAFAENLGAQVTLFLLRGGMMRCSLGLRRSILMDHVKREMRARWNSLEGLTVASWSGSAVIGGYLIDHYGYRQCFFLTSCIYFVGILVESLLLPLTRGETSSHDKARAMPRWWCC